MKKLLLLLIFIIPSYLSKGQNQEQYYQSGFKKYRLGEYVNAIKDFDKAIDLNTKNTITNDATYFRAQSKFFLEDYYGAIYDFTTFLNINYEFCEGYWNRGMVKEKIGDLVGACQDYKKASVLCEHFNEQYDENCN